MTRLVRVAGKGLKVAEFSASCEGSVRVANKGVSRGAGWEQDEAKEVKEVKEVEEAREKAGVGWMEEKVCGFGEDNMKECSMELARR